MILHYYTPAVPHSYCVGVHNGHGFGSLFAKLFSKVAVKSAAKAAGIAAKTAAKAAGAAAKTATKAVTKAGLQLGKNVAKKTVKEFAKQGTEVLKETAKGAVHDLTNAGVDFALGKIAQAQEKAINSKVPASFVNSLAAAATGGVQHVRDKVPQVNSLIDQQVDKARGKIETVAGIKRAPKVATAHRVGKKIPVENPNRKSK